jgi:hypothetical protein
VARGGRCLITELRFAPGGSWNYWPDIEQVTVVALGCVMLHKKYIKKSRAFIPGWPLKFNAVKAA